jgi:ubiquinone/menaquinone biosynthesis C-methylase UbiE
MDHGYIHGFSRAEQQRLVTQADTLAPGVFGGMDLPAHGRLLEIGCGVGAQLKLIATAFPKLHLTGIDLSRSHLAAARDHLADELVQGRVELVHGDAVNLPFDTASFDCVITIWMLEHVPDPRPVLAEARRVLRPGGRLICTEVDNARFGFTPEQPDIMHWWNRFNRFQADRGGNPYVGANLAECSRGLGFSRIDARTLRFIDSLREPQRHLELLDYLKDLLMSGADQLIDAGYATEADRQRMERQFEAARTVPDLRYHYHVVRLTCSVDGAA